MPDAAGDGDDGPAALTVSELNAHIAGVVDDPTFRSVACVGEVSDWYQNDTTCYFTVIDGDAELDCPLWTSRHRRLDCEVEDGDEVFLRGAVDYWTDGGKLQLKPSDLRVLGRVTDSPPSRNSAVTCASGDGSTRTESARCPAIPTGSASSPPARGTPGTT